MPGSMARRISLVLVFGLLLGFTPPDLVSAETDLTFTVNTTDDGADFAINGVCSVGSINAGPCSVRAAVSEVYWNLPYGDMVINIPSGEYILTIPPDLTNDVNSGDLNIPSTSSIYSITINGVGEEPAVIDANGLDRVFDIGSGVNIIINNVVIKGGYLSATEENIHGAGIQNYGNLTLNRVVIKDNLLECGLPSCTFWMHGGGIYTSGGTVNISGSSIQHNTSPNSSAIYNTTGTLNLDHSDVTNNISTDAYTIHNSGYFNIRNSTIAGNISTNFSGIENYGTLSIASSTFANQGILGAIGHFFGSVSISDSILMAVPNTEGTQYNCFLAGDPDWTSLGHNIFSDDSCPATGTGDLVNTDPKLGNLGDWGGPTLTIPLIQGSPAIDHREGVCPSVSGAFLVDDQRYFPRDDGKCDTGAFEGFFYDVSVFLPLVLK